MLYVNVCLCGVSVPWHVCADQNTTCGESVLSLYHVEPKQQV